MRKQRALLPSPLQRVKVKGSTLGKTRKVTTKVKAGLIGANSPRIGAGIPLGIINIQVRDQSPRKTRGKLGINSLVRRLKKGELSQKPRAAVSQRRRTRRRKVTAHRLLLLLRAVKISLRPVL